MHVAIKAIVLHCNYYLINFLINQSIHSCKPYFYCFILQLLSKLCDLFCELCVCPHIYVINLIWYHILSGQDTSPPRISSWIIFFEQIAPSSTAPEAKNLPLNIPNKGIVDQDCLINYAEIEGNSKSAGCRTYFVYLIV